MLYRAVVYSIQYLFKGLYLDRFVHEIAEKSTTVSTLVPFLGCIHNYGLYAYEL